MRLGIPKEIRDDEARVAIIPESCPKLANAGLDVGDRERRGGSC